MSPHTSDGNLDLLKENDDLDWDEDCRVGTGEELDLEVGFVSKDGQGQVGLVSKDGQGQVGLVSKDGQGQDGLVSKDSQGQGQGLEKGQVNEKDVNSGDQKEEEERKQLSVSWPLND